MKFIKSRIAFFAAVAGTAALMLSCSNNRVVETLKREQLYTMSYGLLEDQLNLFTLEGSAAPLKTRLAMRDGIFYIVNGSAGKVLTTSSFGDLLAMIYNPERNPPPIVLKIVDPNLPVDASQAPRTRSAVSYPFNEPGEIAVNSKRSLFVEDRVPEERRSKDAETGAELEYVVVRFASDGTYMDYLGQEGVGGTPFPFISGVHITANDECIVVTVIPDAWTVFMFDERGALKSTVTIRRNELPHPDTGGKQVPDDERIASLDSIYPDPESDTLLIKIDYFRETVDPETKTPSGIILDSSYVWQMDRGSGVYIGKHEIPAFESISAKKNGEAIIARSWDFVGSARGSLFFTSSDEDGATYYALYGLSNHSFKRYQLRIDAEELKYTAYSLSLDGILSAVLCTEFEARLVWWRFDKILGGIGS